MKNISDFQKDLEYGEEGENILDSVLLNQNIEVKRDRLAHKTKRFYIEYESRGEPSGIKTSPANLWALMSADCGLTILVQTEKLRNALRDFIKECDANKLEPLKTYQKLGGDENTSKGVLIGVQDLTRLILNNCSDR